MRLTLEAKQSILIDIKHHFMREGAELARDENGACYYRKSREASDPCRCALGVQIPDEKYTPECEGMPLDRLIPEYTNIEMDTSLGSDDIAWLSRLQKQHDTATSVEIFLIRLEAYAAGSGLNFIT